MKRPPLQENELTLAGSPRSSTPVLRSTLHVSAHDVCQAVTSAQPTSRYLATHQPFWLASRLQQRTTTQPASHVGLPRSRHRVPTNTQLVSNNSFNYTYLAVKAPPLHSANPCWTTVHHSDDSNATIRTLWFQCSACQVATPASQLLTLVPSSKL